jgi:hypothetical protein
VKVRLSLTIVQRKIKITKTAHICTYIRGASMWVKDPEIDIFFDTSRAAGRPLSSFFVVACFCFGWHTTRRGSIQASLPLVFTPKKKRNQIHQPSFLFFSYILYIEATECHYGTSHDECRECFGRDCETCLTNTCLCPSSRVRNRPIGKRETTNVSSHTIWYCLLVVW